MWQPGTKRLHSGTLAKLRRTCLLGLSQTRSPIPHLSKTNLPIFFPTALAFAVMPQWLQINFQSALGPKISCCSECALLGIIVAFCISFKHKYAKEMMPLVFIAVTI